MWQSLSLVFMSVEVPDTCQGCGKTMKTEFITTVLPILALFVLTGCGDGDRAPESSPAVKTESTTVSTNAEISAGDVEAIVGEECFPGGDKSDVCSEEKREVERVLGKDMSSIPPSLSRYEAQCVRAQELWEHLVLIASNDVTYVICSAARLQALWENDLSKVRIPERTIAPEPVRRTPDGVYYSVYTNREMSRIVRAETMAIQDAEAYLHQLRVFAENSANGIDSQYLYHMYRSLDEKARDEVMNRVTTILGRAPRWEKWQRR